MLGPKKSGSGKKKDKFGGKYLDLLIARGVNPEDLPDDLKGNPVHIPQVNFDVPMEQKVRAKMGPPPYAIRAKYVEDLVREMDQDLAKKWSMVAATYRADPPKFSSVWTAIIETLELDDLNRLIKEHNTFYPIEANLREHPETGHLMIGATPWKPKSKITPQSLLAKFPADLAVAQKEND